MNDWLKSHTGEILTGVGCLGMIATVIEAIRETRAETTRPETLKETVESHPRTVIFGTVSLGCFIGAQITSRKHAAAFDAALIAITNGFEHYKERASVLAGDELDREIMQSTMREVQDSADGNPPWDEYQRFCIEGHGQLFKCTMLDIIRAEYHFNRYLATHAYATANDMYDFFGVDLKEDGDKIGWDMMSSEVFKGYRWIDFEHEHRFVANGAMQICIIRPKQKPVMLSISAKNAQDIMGT